MKQPLPRVRRRTWLGLLGAASVLPCVLAGLLVLAASNAIALAQPVVQFGPEVNVGASFGHPELSQYQSDLRVDPTDTKRMCITCKRYTTPTLAERETMLFFTRDGGATWTVAPLPASGDPDVVYDLQGHAHWSFISQSPDHKRPLGYRRSLDGGATWEATRWPDMSVLVDHPHSICDRSAVSKFKGSIYIAGRSFKGGGIAVLRTRDGGNTFQSTQIPLEGKLGLGFVYKPAILSDGTLVIPVVSGNQFLADSRNYYAGNIKAIYCIRSRDGGVTFDPPILVTPLSQPGDAGVGGSAALGGFAVGKWGRGERIYLCYALQRAGRQPAALALTRSDDGGSTWTAPKSVAPSTPAGWGAGSSSIMANADGVVGIQYYSLKNKKDFDIYFTTSVDGGQTFSTPERVSTATSHAPERSARAPGQDQVYGDAAPDGTFRLVWTDKREGAPEYVIYYRQTRVETRKRQSPVTLTVSGGFGGGTYDAGALVSLTAAPAPEGQEFASWTAVSPGIKIADPTLPITEATLAPGTTGDVTLMAVFRPQTLYTLKVEGGSGGGKYPAGTMVKVSADPIAAGKKFVKWQAANGVGFLDQRSASTHMRMPAHDETVTATVGNL